MSGYSLIELGPKVGDAAGVAILAHGRGGSPEDMARLAAALDAPDIAFLLPGAPNNTWYPESFLAPIESNEPWLSESLGAHARLIESVIDRGVPPERIALGGFSQGACLTAETLIRAPRRYGAALILTGGAIGPPGTKWPRRPGLDGMPVYMSGSETDRHVPPSRQRETEAALKAAGAVVEMRIFDDRPHTVSSEEIARSRAYLRAMVETTEDAGRRSAD